MNCKNFSVLKVNDRHKINLQDENDVVQRRMTQFAKYHTAFANYEKRGVFTMASTVPEAKEALNRFKMEAASEVGVFCIKIFQNALFKPLSRLEKYV